MKPQIVKELEALQKAGVLSAEAAEDIRSYYQKKGSGAPARMLIVFSILGAALVGLGVILIIAHNWDDLSRPIKSLLALVPLLMAQGLCAYALWRKRESRAWREAAGVLLFFAVGASISLISQIYNIPGSLDTFLLTWMALCLPVLYIMDSSMSSLLYLIGITTYAAEAGYWNWRGDDPYLYWLLLALVVPYYIRLIKNQPGGNFTSFHNWFIPGSLLMALGTLTQDAPEYMFMAYLALLGIFYLIGNRDFLKNSKIRNNGYLVQGSLGTMGILLALSFNWFWKDMATGDLSDWSTAPELWLSIILILAGLVLLVRYQRFTSKDLVPQELLFIIFVPIFFMGSHWPVLSQVLINACVFLMGLFVIRKGARQDHLGVLNYGLLIITALVICRFFDTNMSFVLRGMLFVAVGVGFFLANYFLIKSRKAHV
ncbi:MAG: DUF2157 domain-containing protein [Cyclobacteriaceae bacterium]|nr:DUF2157 domain-containing protein [Cyclobacteriaceae bacterium]